MRLTSLHDQIATLDRGALALAGERRRLTRTELLSVPACVEDAAAGGSVALLLRDPVALAWALVSLDGTIDRLLLLSTDSPSSVRAELLAQAKVNCVLSDIGPPGVHDGMRFVAWEDEPAKRAPIARPGTSRKTEWIVATSGTTGRPKLVAHDLESLTRITSRNAESGRRHRWGELYDICRFAGLQVFLQAVVGGSVLLLPDLTTELDDQILFLVQQGCTALSATPTLWRKILMSSHAVNLDLRQITLGGEIADAGILSALRATFPSARVVHIYASTEAGAAFSVTDGLPGFPASYLQAPPKGIRLKVDDGMLYVENANARTRYLGDDRTIADEGGWISTGDRVILENGRFLFQGRASGSINVGGNKVMPEEIERVLLEHPSVLFARVSAKPSPITGSLVVAEVVAADDHTARHELTKLLRDFCGQRLEKWKVPAMIRIVDTLSLNHGGKLERR